MKWLRNVLVVLTVLVATAQLLMPAAAQWGLKKVLASSYPQATRTSVQVYSSPGIEILSGRMDRVIIRADQVNLGALKASEMSLLLRDARVDLSKLLFERQLNFAADSQQLEVTLTEQALNDYLEQVKIPLLHDVNIDIGATAVELTGVIVVVGQQVNVTVNGTITLENGKLKFKPKAAGFNGVDFAPSLQRRVLSRVNFIVPLTGMPVAGNFNAIRQFADKVVLTSKVGGE